jgi:putative ABC transport system substrate-binding protein
VTRTLPIVSVGVIDPEDRGIVSRLARPGGNITGLTSHAADLNGKRLEILKELLPGLKRVAVLWNPANPTNQPQLTDTEAAARKLGVQVQPLPINSPGDFEPAFKAARGAGALLQLDGPFPLTHRTRLVKLAKRSQLPGIYGFKEVVEAGGLMSYGAHYEDLYRRAATYVDKILKGAKPADLPVEQPTKFELIINLKTAKALGLTIPQSLLSRADEMIQ